MRRRGFTLIEALTALAVGTGVAVAGLVLTADFHKFHHRHTGTLEAGQKLRRTLELIGQDVRNAGVGVGYRPDGRFAGLIGGAFTVSGGASFTADDRALQTPDGPVLVDDLGVRRALGERRTVLYLEEGQGEICAGLEFEPDELVAVSSRSGRAGRTLRVLSASAGTCTRGQCTGGCSVISYGAAPGYRSHAGVESASFTAGDLFKDYERVVWFVTVGEDGRTQLRRVGARTEDACAAADATCGSLAAEGVELLQYRVAVFDRQSETWVPVEMSDEIDRPGRLRMDIEVVARGRSDPGVGRTPIIRSQLAPGVCLPGPCGQAEADGVPRVALRTTVEVRNAGRLRIR